MKIYVLLILVLLWGVGLPAKSDFKLQKNLMVDQDTHYADSVVSLGGRIEVRGVAEQSIFMVGGSLVIEGQVNKDVICFATDVKIGKSARIRGELLLIGGNLERHEESRVNGEFFYFRFDLKKIESTLIPIISDSKTIAFLRIIKIIFWFILALLVLAIVPQKIMLAHELFEKNIVKMGVIGLISMLSFLFLLILFIVLLFLIIGIPLLLLLILVYFCVLILGRTVIFYYIGNRISGMLGLRNISASFLLLFGVLFYTVLKFLPVLGPMVLAVMGIFELGIGIGFILRNRISLKN